MYCIIVIVMLSRNDFLDLFTNGPNEFINELKKIPRSVWDFKPSPENMCINEIINHVVEVDVHYYIRARAAIAEPGKTIMPYDEPTWMKTLIVPEVSVDDLLELLRVIRKINGDLFRSLPEEKWKSTINHPEFGIIDLDTIMTERAKHISDHIAQIRRRHKEWLELQKTPG